MHGAYAWCKLCNPCTLLQVLRSDPRYRKLEHTIQSGGKAQEDDDLAVTDSEVTYTDPWSKKLITGECVTNRACGHVYDKAVVLKFIEMKKTTKCPVVGCSNRNPISKVGGNSPAS